MKRCLVLGAGGFIGSWMVKTLSKNGLWVMGVDLKLPSFSVTHADRFMISDLRKWSVWESLPRDFDEIYQFAADMGGAGFVFTGDNDAEIIHNNALINLNCARWASELNKGGKVFFSSSACVYPSYAQKDPDIIGGLREKDAYPADPDSEYGWEKLFSERVYLSFKKNKNLDVRIARYHNIYGPEGCWRGGREKAPAAICRKVALADNKIEIWGPGTQTRSFLYIDDCIEATLKLMESDYSEPINIGSTELISINDLAKMVIQISGKDIKIVNVEGPVGVMGRNSDNTIVEKVLNWTPRVSLYEGMKETYKWIESQARLINCV